MEKDWNKFAKKNLLGKTIASVRYMTKAEAKAMYWESRPLAIFFTDGSYIFPSMDDEGNDGGALFGKTSNGEDLTFPVL
jgi:hypothetical protein